MAKMTKAEIKKELWDLYKHSSLKVTNHNAIGEALKHVPEDPLGDGYYPVCIDGFQKIIHIEDGSAALYENSGSSIPIKNLLENAVLGDKIEFPSDQE